MNSPTKELRTKSAAGFSLLELVAVIAIVGIVSTFALSSYLKANRSFTIAGTARNLSAYLEKARIDSVRRHGGASITINDRASYIANIDFSGQGTATARTISLPQGTRLSYSLPPATTNIDPSVEPITITYDWRGRTTSTVLLTLTDSNAGMASTTVVVGPAGDLSTDTTVTGPVTTPTPQNTTVSTSAGIKTMQY
jgi:prepilin-type N-terminal cleavage/methylation domain-containing protein